MNKGRKVAKKKTPLHILHTQEFSKQEFPRVSNINIYIIN